MKRNEDGSFEYFTKAQVKYHFDGAIDAGLLRENQGTLAYLEDPSGNRTQLFYEAEGRLE